MNYRQIMCAMVCGWVMATSLLTAQPSERDGQNWRLPLDVQPLLSGNYAELRQNHFHAGLDFKTAGAVGHPVYAVEDGYVARAVVNAYGYGLVLYVKHPKLQLMTVYAHLQAFDKKIAERIRAYQQEHEINNPDVTFAPEDFPVRRGQCIAKSGNTGTSGGPHLHFEVRGIDNDEFYDPITYYLNDIKDRTAPRLRNVYLYPRGGTVCGYRTRQSAKVVTLKGGGKGLNRKLTAWGKIGIGLKAYDYMDGTNNYYGVKYMRVYVDDSLRYAYAQHKFHYDERRYVNALTDYAAWKQQRSMIIKCFVEPGNRLNMLDHSLGDGVIEINEERTYRCRVELEDAHANVRKFSFDIVGKPTAIPEPPEPKGLVVAHDRPFAIDTAGCRLMMPAGTLYADHDFRFSAQPTTNPKYPCVGNVFVLDRHTTPMHDYAHLWIAIPDTVPAAMHGKLYVANVTEKSVPLAATYVEAGQQQAAQLQTKVRELGKYALRLDTVPPTATLVGKPTMQRVQVKIGDTGSGVVEWRGTIDGEFVPFDMNNRGSLVAFPRLFGVRPNSLHEIVLTLSDRCGNETTLRQSVRF